jgi:hypothetical protein
VEDIVCEGGGGVYYYSTCVCVYYCSTYDKAVRVGGTVEDIGAKRDYEPRPAWTNLQVCVYYCTTYYKAVRQVCVFITACCVRCVCLLLQDLVQSCLHGGGGDMGGHVLRETTSAHISLFFFLVSRISHFFSFPTNVGHEGVWEEDGVAPHGGTVISAARNGSTRVSTASTGIARAVCAAACAPRFPATPRARPFCARGTAWW